MIIGHFVIFFILATMSGVYRIPGLHVPYVIVVIFANFFYLNRVVQHNNQIDNQVRGVLAEYQQRLAGRAMLAFVTQHTGLCKPKHARVVRQIWFGPPGALHGGGYVQPQMMTVMSPQTMTGLHPAQPGTYVPGASYPPPTAAASTTVAHPTAAAPQPVAAIQREVFYLTVPKGVESGQTFDAKTPSGRTVTVTAPTGAREGMEFQVSA